MSETTAAKKSNSMPRWMFVAGVLIAIAGWMTRNYAASMMDRALYMAPVRESERHLPPIPGYQPDLGPTVAQAASVGYIGLGLIIFSAALFLAG